MSSYSFSVASGLTTVEPIDPAFKTIGGNFLSLIDIYELSAAYDCPVAPACPSGGITINQNTGTIDATNLAMECRYLFIKDTVHMIT